MDTIKKDERITNEIWFAFLPSLVLQEKICEYNGIEKYSCYRGTTWKINCIWGISEKENLKSVSNRNNVIVMRKLWEELE